MGYGPDDFKGGRRRDRAAVAASLALHVLAALYHQFVLRDGLLGRMGLGRKQ